MLVASLKAKSALRHHLSHGGLLADRVKADMVAIGRNG